MKRLLLILLLFISALPIRAADPTDKNPLQKQSTFMRYAGPTLKAASGGLLTLYGALMVKEYVPLIRKPQLVPYDDPEEVRSLAKKFTAIFAALGVAGCVLLYKGVQGFRSANAHNSGHAI